MRIDSKIVDEHDNLVGYMIDDTEAGGDIYPIGVKKLYEPDIINLLLKLGYTLEDQYVFRSPQGVLITELPAVAFTTLKPDEQREMFSENARLSEFEAAEFIQRPKSQGSDLNAFKQPIQPIIKIRQELLEFAFTNIPFDRNDLRTFLPVNMITDKSALFSVEEIMESEERHEAFAKLLNKCTYTLVAFEC